MSHPAVVRVLALSGGYPREEADRRLRRNRGIIASFSRGLLNDLRVDQSEESFTKRLDEAIASIFDASVNKTTAV